MASNSEAKVSSESCSSRKRMYRANMFESRKNIRNKVNKEKLRTLNNMLKNWYTRTKVPTCALTLLKTKDGSLVVKYSGPSIFEEFGLNEQVSQIFTDIVLRKIEEDRMGILGEGNENRANENNCIDKLTMNTLLNEDVLGYGVNEKRKLLTQIVTGHDRTQKQKWKKTARPLWWPGDIEYRSPNERKQGLPSMSVNHMNRVISAAIEFVKVLCGTSTCEVEEEQYSLEQHSLEQHSLDQYSLDQNSLEQSSLEQNPSEQNSLELNSLEQNDQVAPDVASQGEDERYEVTSLQEALAVVRQHELKHALRYTVQWSKKDFGNPKVVKKKHKVRWDDERRPFNGTPFFLTGYKKLDCQHGKDRQATVKEKRKAKRRENMGHDYAYRRKRDMFPVTKKFGCEAQIKIIEIDEFPGFKISHNTIRRRRNASQKLKLALEANAEPEVAKKFIAIIPHVSKHKYHRIGTEYDRVLELW